VGTGVKKMNLEKELKNVEIDKKTQTKSELQDYYLF
jgi:hypothetical protein